MDHRPSETFMTPPEKSPRAGRGSTGLGPGMKERPKVARQLPQLQGLVALGAALQQPLRKGGQSLSW